MAIIGDTLTNPESGWKRYNENFELFFYEGTWSVESGTWNYGGTAKYSSASGSKLKFNFYGTKLRVIGGYYPDRTVDAKVYIDGVLVGTINENFASKSQVIVFESTGLSLGNHSVEISISNTKVLLIDAIDIESTGRLLHPDEVTNPRNLAIGKRIRCNYRNFTSGKTGYFNRLGLETTNFIPAGSSAVTNGDFYFICVDKDYLGRWKLLADRNIQKAISWDELNSKGFGSTNNGRSMDYIYEFDGNNYIEFNEPKARITGDVTINLKVMLRSYPSTSAFLVVCGGTGETLADNLLYQLYVTSTGKMVVQHEYGSGSNENITTEFSLPINEIVDLTVTRSVVDKKYTIFMNNVKMGDYFYTYNPATNSSANQTLGFGADTNVSPINGYANMVLYSFTLDDQYINDTNYPNYAKTKYEIDKIFSLKPLSDKNFNYEVKMPSGGVSATDKDNEWDNYIVSGLYPKNNDIWKQGGLWSFTSTAVSGTPANRVTRGGSNGDLESYGTAVSGTAYDNTGFRPMMIMETLWVRINRFLLKIGTQYKSWKDNMWTIVSETQPTSQEFSEKGMSNLNFMKDIDLTELGDNPEIVMYTNDKDVQSVSTNIKYIPKPQIVRAIGDIDLSNVFNITSFESVVQVSGTGRVLYVVSADSGATWHTFDGTDFVPISALTEDVVGVNGFDGSTLSSIPSVKWDSFVEDTKTIRFAYYLELKAEGDTALVDELVLKYQNQGYWESVVHGTDYSYLYPSNEMLRVKLYKSGDFKINYFKPSTVDPTNPSPDPTPTEPDSDGLVWSEFNF